MNLDPWLILNLSYRRKSWVHHSTLDPVQNLIYFSGPKNDQKMIHYCWIQKKWHIVDPSGPLNYTKLNYPTFQCGRYNVSFYFCPQKVEKTGFFRAKFLLHCTLSFILGFKCLIRLLISKTLLKKMLNDINWCKMIGWNTWKLEKGLGIWSSIH